MSDANEIARGVYPVGGPQISHAEDAASFVIDLGGEAVMVDCGAERSLRTIVANIEAAGHRRERTVSTLILTRCHIDHIGGATGMREILGLKILVHDLDAEAVEKGDSIRTAAD